MRIDDETSVYSVSKKQETIRLTIVAENPQEKAILERLSNPKGDTRFKSRLKGRRLSVSFKTQE